MMQLNGGQLKQFQQVLVSAFPSINALRIMVRVGLQENLEAIVGSGSLSTVVFDLIEWAQACGRLQELMEKAYHENSGNPELRNFVAQFIDIKGVSSRKSKQISRFRFQTAIWNPKRLVILISLLICLGGGTAFLYLLYCSYEEGSRYGLKQAETPVSELQSSSHIEDQKYGDTTALPTKRINLELESTSLDAGLKLLFAQVGLSYSMDDSLRNIVISAHIKDLPFEQALNVILDASNQPLAYHYENGVISVFPKTGFPGP